MKLSQDPQLLSDKETFKKKNSSYILSINYFDGTGNHRVVKKVQEEEEEPQG